MARSIPMTRFVLCLLAGCLVAPGQTKPNFSGVWEFDPARNPGEKNIPRRMTLKVVQDAASLAVTMQFVSNGSADENSHTYTIGGTSIGSMHGGKMTSDAAWEGSTLVVKSVVKLNQDLLLTDYWSISPDGQSLTFREVSKFGTSPEADNSRVLTKKPDSSWDPEALNKPAGEVFQNMQIFKGVPAKRINGVMTNFTRWMGVRCSHCHDLNAYEKDDKAPKQTARKMFMMVQKINGENGLNGAVTCWTCHRGAAKPESLPAPAKPAQ